MNFVKLITQLSARGANEVTQQRGLILSINNNGSYQVQIDDVTYSQIWSNSGEPHQVGQFSNVISNNGMIWLVP